MTLEKLLGLSADDWDKLDQEELKKWAALHFTVTKPDIAKVAARKEAEKGKRPAVSVSSLQKTLMDIENLRKMIKT